MPECFFLPLTFFFFFNLGWLNLTIAAGISPKKFPCKRNSATTCPLWLVCALCPDFFLHTHKSNDTTTRSAVFPREGWYRSSWPPHKRKLQENMGLLGLMARVSHLSPTGVARRHHCIQRDRDTTAAAISLLQTETDVCSTFFLRSNMYYSFCPFSMQKSIVYGSQK